MPIPYPFSLAENIVVPTLQANFLTLSGATTPNWIDYTGILGNRTQYDSSGTLTWAPANMLVNSATLATQNVTTLAQNYILSFYGTGSVACSGTSTTVLTGTGVGNRVSSVLTTTAGTLTLTVSGSVTSAQLEPVTYETTPRTYIDTGASAIYQPRYDYNPTTLAAQGILIEESRANLLTYSQTLATNWTDTNITRVSTTRTSPDGTANALEASASAANGTIIRSAAIGTSAARTLSVWLKRVSGTGDIQYTLDNGGTWTTQAITSSWTRYTFASTSANQQVGFRIVTSGDTIQIWGAQLEVGVFATSYIPTTNTSISRVADNIKWTSSAITTYWVANVGSYLAEAAKISTAASALIAASDGTAINRIITSATTTVTGTITITSTSSMSQSLGAVSANTPYRGGIAFASNNMNIAANGLLGILDTSGSIPTINQVGIGYNVASNSWLNGWMRSFAYYNQRISDNSLKRKSAVGAPY